MNTSKSLDEILDFIENYAVSSSSSDFAYYPEKRTQAKQAIVEAVEGLIGEDEPEIIFNKLLPGQPYIHNKGRNNLRAELRQAIKEWQ